LPAKDPRAPRKFHSLATIAAFNVLGPADAEGSRRPIASGIMEYEEATHLYRRTVAGGDDVFHLTPARPSAALSYRDEDTWYLRGEDGRLIARVNRLGVRVGETVIAK
jgi:hypothetical protein